MIMFFRLLSSTLCLKKHRVLSLNKPQSLFLHRCMISNQGQVEEEQKFDSENEDQFDPVNTKLKILEASLPFVPEYGWSRKALSLGAQSIGLASTAHGVISDGGVDLIHYFNYSSNHKLELLLKERTRVRDRLDLQTFLESAIDDRLKMVIPYVSKLSEAMALVMLPTQLPTDTKNLLNLVDSIWYYSGHKAIDMQWYSRRVFLGAAYKACELSLIQDKSPDFTDTKEFLRRRVERILETNNIMNEFTESASHLAELSQGAFVTMRNLLGANSRFR